VSFTPSAHQVYYFQAPGMDVMDVRSCATGAVVRCVAMLYGWFGYRPFGFSALLNAGDTYQITIGGDSSLSLFSLQVDTFTTYCAGNLSMPADQVIGPGLPARVSGDMALARIKNVPFSCRFGEVDGPDFTYVFTPAATTSYSVTTQSDGTPWGNTYAVQVSTCAGVVVACYLAFDTALSTYSFALQQGVQYSIAISQQGVGDSGSSLGPFKFNLTLLESAAVTPAPVPPTTPTTLAPAEPTYAPTATQQQLVQAAASELGVRLGIIAVLAFVGMGSAFAFLMVRRNARKKRELGFSALYGGGKPPLPAEQPPAKNKAPPRPFRAPPRPAAGRSPLDA
jgi:hypothetical protein